MAGTASDADGTVGPARGVVRRLFTWRVNLYRLIVGVVVLAIVLPAWAYRVQAVWLVVLGCVLVVVAAVVTGRRVPFVRDWLRR